MPAHVTNTDYRPDAAPVRHYSYCDACRTQTHLALGVEDPTCAVCGLPFERPALGPDQSARATSPFSYLKSSDGPVSPGPVSPGPVSPFSY